MAPTVPPTGLVRVVTTDEAVARLTDICRGFEQRYGVPTAELERAFVSAGSDELQARADRRAWRNARDRLARLTAAADGGPFAAPQDDCSRGADGRRAAG